MAVMKTNHVRDGLALHQLGPSMAAPGLIILHLEVNGSRQKRAALEAAPGTLFLFIFTVKLLLRLERPRRDPRKDRQCRRREFRRRTPEAFRRAKALAPAWALLPRRPRPR